jgi:hypothetical protein
MLYNAYIFPIQSIIMVDYTAIADAAAAYPDYQSAFTAMLVEPAADTYKDLSPSKLKVWSASFSDDYLLLKSGTDAISLLAVSMIESETAPLSVSDPSVHQFINALPVSQSGKDAIFTMATQENLAWPGLKPGHVQNAMQKRAEGIV